MDGIFLERLPTMRSATLSYQFLLITASIASLAACSSQAPPDYPGDAIATIRGTVITGNRAPPPALEIAVLYYGHNVRWDKTSFGDRVPVSGTSISGFKLDLFTPPPADAFPPANFDGVTPETWTVGYIVALIPGADTSRVKPSDIAGVSLDYMVLYFGADGTSGSSAEWIASQYLVPATRGYHLSAMHPLSLPGREAERKAFRQCLSIPGLCTYQESNLPGNYQEYDVLRSLYDECLNQTPRPDSCLTYNVSNPTPEQIAANKECNEKIEAKGGYPKGPCPRPDVVKTNPDDLNATVTITLGATLLDAMKQWH